MLRMSTKGHHATRIMIFLAGSPARPVSKAEIGGAEDISAGYLQQLMTTLTDAGLVRSYRGKNGGFTLARPAQDISVRQVIQATEGALELAPCLAAPQDCLRAETCSAHVLWCQATDMVNDLFDRTSIEDLATSAQVLRQSHL